MMYIEKSHNEVNYGSTRMAKYYTLEVLQNIATAKRYCPDNVHKTLEGSKNVAIKLMDTLN